MNIGRNGKFLAVCLSVVALVTIGVVGFMFYARVGEPLFIKNYCEYNWDSNGDGNSLSGYFRIQYLADSYDSRRVTGIEFPELPEGEAIFYASEFDEIYVGDVFGIYSVHTVEVSISPAFLRGERGDSEMVLRNAVVRFSDGSTREVDFGEIRIRERTDNSRRLISQRSTSAVTMPSGDYYMETYRGNEDFTVVDFSVTPLFDAAGLFAITLNDIPIDEIAGMEINRGDAVVFRTDFFESDEDAELFVEYCLRTVFTAKDSLGLEISRETGFVSAKPRFGFWKILRFVTGQGRGEV